MDLDYPILSDPDGKAAKAYGIYNEARGFSGRVTFFIGKDGKVLHVEKKVKTKDHGKQIIDKLKELKVEPAPKDEKKKK